MVKRRHLYFDSVVPHRPHPVEDVLLRRLRAGRGAIRRRADEPVDELVRTRRGKRAGRRTREDLPACELHVVGRTRTRLRRMRVTFRFTCVKVYGGATCSLTT